MGSSIDRVKTYPRLLAPFRGGGGWGHPIDRGNAPTQGLDPVLGYVTPSGSWMVWVHPIDRVKTLSSVVSPRWGQGVWGHPAIGATPLHRVSTLC